MAQWSVGTGTRGALLTLDVNVIAQSVAGNYSTIAASLSITGVPSATFKGDATAAAISGIGAAVGGSFTWASGTTGKVILSFTRDVAHAADGTLYLEVAGSIGATGTTGLGGPTGLGAYAFYAPTIARASNPTFSSATVNAGSPVTIYTNRASTGFTHTLTYAFGSATGTIATGVADSVSWTPSLDLLNQIPNNTSGSATITCHTYSGATLIGSRAVALTIAAGPAIIPDFTTITHSEAVPAVASTVGAYVQSLSRLNLELTGAAGVYGSTITSYRITVGDQIIASSSGTTTTPIITAGTLPIVGTITDSRGRTVSKTVNVNVLAYQPPVVNSWSAQRATAAGVPANDGTFIRVAMDIAAYSLIVGTQKNSLRYIVKTALRGTSSWTTKVDVTLPSGLAFDSFVTFGDYVVSNAYNVQLEVVDKFNTTIVATTVGSSSVLTHFGADGVGFGKYWERGSADAFEQMYQNDGKRVLDEDNYGPLIEPAISAAGKTYTGTVDPLWTSGKPKVTLTGTSTVVYPLLPAFHNDVQPGQMVVLERLPGDLWYIVSVASPTNAFPRRYKMPLGPGWTQYSQTEIDWMHGTATVADGIVSLNGLVFTAATSTSGSVIATFPIEWAPNQRLMFGVNNGDTWRAVDVYPDGTVRSRGVGSGSYISLAGLAWPLESTVAAAGGWINVGQGGSAFANGWVNYVSGGIQVWGDSRFWKDPITGMVWVQGLVMSGSTATAASIFTLPVGYRPAKTNHFATTSADGLGTLYATASQISNVAAANSNGFLSLCGIVFEPEGGALIPFRPYILVNGWLQYDPTVYTTGSNMKSPNGMIYHQGLIRSGPITTPAVNMAKDERMGHLGTTSYALFNRLAGNARARLDLRNNAIIPQQGSTTWYSMDGLIYTADREW